MPNSTRILRTLLLALVLPALLAPSGWSARVCLCSLFSGFSDTEACCTTQEPEFVRASAGKSASDAEFSCCSGGADERPSPNDDGAACSHGGDDACCRLLEADDIELAWSAADSVKLPFVVPAASLEVLPPAPQPQLRRAHACTHSLAPPRASTPLPLRI